MGGIVGNKVGRSAGSEDGKGEVVGESEGRSVGSEDGTGEVVGASVFPKLALKKCFTSTLKKFFTSSK